MILRRNLLIGAGALVAAPFVLPYEKLMPVRTPSVLRPPRRPIIRLYDPSNNLVRSMDVVDGLAMLTCSLSFTVDLTKSVIEMPGLPPQSLQVLELGPHPPRSGHLLNIMTGDTFVIRCPHTFVIRCPHIEARHDASA